MTQPLRGCKNIYFWEGIKVLLFSDKADLSIPNISESSLRLFVLSLTTNTLSRHTILAYILFTKSFTTPGNRCGISASHLPKNTLIYTREDCEEVSHKNIFISLISLFYFHMHNRQIVSFKFKDDIIYSLRVNLRSAMG